MIELKFTVEKLNIVLLGLYELQSKVSMNIILELQEEAKKQLSEQNKAKE